MRTSVLSIIIVFMTAGLLIALTPVVSSALDPSFFQGFEVDTSGWFPYNSDSVTRVPSGDTSSSYNSGTTSVYASGIDAALGDYFGRVTSAISTSNCILDDSAPLPAQLLCPGPYTVFGRDYTVPYPFPDGGYTIQVDIYLDADYASHHPDCGRPGPCVPDMPGTLNLACTTLSTDPVVINGFRNGLACEGSRFDWTVAINNPAATAEIAPEFVFSVGTAPAPAVYGITGCDQGWIITTGYNSYRSGGDTYNLGFEPKCLSTSGWYTFKQVYKNDGTGFLEVDFSILDQGGNVVSCKDAAGNASTCEWVRKPGNAISDVGCPRYGWLANEEINDLPLDNTELFVEGCGVVSVGQITPTDTTCQQYADGYASTLDLLQYTVKGGKINSVAPGVFFYYTKVEGAEGSDVTITESHTGVAPDIKVLKNQVVLYSDSCTKLAWESLTVDPDGSATGTLPYTGSFIIGVKYDASSLKGKGAPSPQSIDYTFGTGAGGTTNSATITLDKK